MRAAWLLLLVCSLARASAGGFVIVDVQVNGIAQRSAVIWVTSEGDVLARRSDVIDWSVDPDAAATTVVNDTVYIRLSTLTSVSVRLEGGNLWVSAESAAFRGARVDLLKTTELVWEGGHGAYLNYDFTSFAARGTRPFSGVAVEGVAYWDAISVATSAVATDNALGRRFLRSESSLRRDFPESMRSLILGDAVSRSGLLARSFRFGGFSFGTNFATRPDLVTFALPAVSGESRVPTAADVLINGQTRAQLQLPAGPFEIANLPAINGAGEIQLLTRDALGRQQVLVVPFYVSPSLLKPELTDAGIEIGKVREDFGLSSARYGRMFARGTWRRGLTADQTLEAFAETVGRQHTVGTGATVLVKGVAIANAGIAASAGASKGVSVVAAIERTASVFSAGLRGEWASRDFAQLGGSPGLRQRIYANAGLSLGTFGSAGIVTVADSHYDRVRTQTYGVTYQKQISRQIALQANYTLTQVNGESRRFAGIVLSMPLDTFTSASLSTTLQGTDLEHILDVRQNLPVDEGWATRARLVRNDTSRIDAGATWQNAEGRWSVDVNRAASTSTLRVNASGSIVAAGGLIRPVRQLGDAFAIVSVPGHPGIDVFHENQRVAKTDAQGYAIIPRLRAYESNNIAVNALQLKLSTEIKMPTRSVAPARRAGVVVRFDAVNSQGALVRVVTEDGKPVPAGATLTALGSSFPVAANGDVYVTNINNEVDALIEWSGKRCRLRIPAFDRSKLLPRIGPLTCFGAGL